MKRLLLLVLLLIFPTVATADATLESRVNRAWLDRGHSGWLHDIAHARVVEIVTDFTHDGLRSGTAEVLGWNSGAEDPIAEVIRGWKASADHNTILSDPDYNIMGCAELVTTTRHWFACILAVSTSPDPSTPAPQNTPILRATNPPLVELPNTGMQ